MKQSAFQPCPDWGVDQTKSVEKSNLPADLEVSSACDVDVVDVAELNLLLVVTTSLERNLDYRLTH